MLDRRWSRLIRLPRGIPSAIWATRQTQKLGADYGLLQTGIISPIAKKRRNKR